MKLFYDEEDNKFIQLEEIGLGQGLGMVYSVADKSFLVVDPDTKKDYEGKAYSETLTAVSKDTGKEVTVGIVQTLKKEVVEEFKRLFDYLELEKL